MSTNTIYDCKALIESERTYLRELQLDEGHHLSAIYSDKRIMKDSVFGPMSTAEIESLLRKIHQSYHSNQFGIWPVFTKTDDRLLGVCGIERKNVACKSLNTITYRFHQSSWGQGFASEVVQAVLQYAFTKLQLDDIHAIIKPNNAASLKIAQNAGMTYSGMTSYLGHELQHFVLSNSIEQQAPTNIKLSTVAA